MKKIHLKIIGSGNINLVLLHGWGINKNIWHWIEKLLSTHFKLYLIDLPGYGQNYHIKIQNINHIVYMINKITPNKCIFMGWSMGGIIASYMGLIYPKKTISIITIASSPYFLSEQHWPGINKKLLYQFLLNLIHNYKKTIIRFLKINVLNIMSNIHNIYYINNILLSKPYPTEHTLKNNFNMLCSVDLRKKILSLKCPVLRIYGKLDSIIPIQVSKILDTNIHTSIKSIIIDNASHIPFVSQPLKFCNILINFKQWIIYNTNNLF